MTKGTGEEVVPPTLFILQFVAQKISRVLIKLGMLGFFIGSMGWAFRHPFGLSIAILCWFATGLTIAFSWLNLWLLSQRLSHPFIVAATMLHFGAPSAVIEMSPPLGPSKIPKLILQLTTERQFAMRVKGNLIIGVQNASPMSFNIRMIGIQEKQIPLLVEVLKQIRQ